MNNLEKWCNDLLSFWKNKEVEKIIDLFDENVEYYETPNMLVENIGAIKTMWEEIYVQDTSNIELKILCQNNNKIIANYILHDKVSYDMIYEIELNENNKCVYFKQWYMEY